MMPAGMHRPSQASAGIPAGIVRRGGGSFIFGTMIPAAAGISDL